MPEREFGPVAIQALRFQVEAYRKFGIISHWLIDKKKLYKIGGEEVQSWCRSHCDKANIKFQSEKPSVIHTKHDNHCKKSQGR